MCSGLALLRLVKAASKCIIHNMLKYCEEELYMYSSNNDLSLAVDAESQMANFVAEILRVYRKVVLLT